MKAGESEADNSTLAPRQTVGAVHLVADVVGHPFIELRLRLGERELHRRGPALWEEGPTIEAQQLLLDHPAPEVGGVVGCPAAAALEAVGVKQRKEELEVLRVTGMGRGGEEEEMPGDPTQEAAETVALGLPNVVPLEVGAHLVGLIDHDEVPIRGRQLGLKLLAPGELVHADDEDRLLQEGVGGVARLDPLAGEDVEVEIELLP